ncbi:hypothetical protein D3C86_2200730 [compost metagenome]
MCASTITCIVLMISEFIASPYQSHYLVIVRRSFTEGAVAGLSFGDSAFSVHDNT